MDHFNFLCVYSICLYICELDSRVLILFGNFAVYSVVLHRKNKVMRVWNSMRASKRCQNFHFWVNNKSPELVRATVEQKQFSSGCAALEGFGDDKLRPAPKNSLTENKWCNKQYQIYGHCTICPLKNISVWLMSRPNYSAVRLAVLPPLSRRRTKISSLLLRSANQQTVI